MIKIIRTSTIPLSLNILLKGQLKYLSTQFEVLGVSSSGKDLQEVSLREDVRTISIEMERGISPIKDLASLLKLYRLFKKEKPQIIHSITPKAGLLSMVAGKLAGVPIRMHTFTGLIFPSKKGMIQKLLIFMDKVLCACATNIYPEGNGVKKDLENYKITSKPLKVLANGNVNGIDMGYFTPEAIPKAQKALLKTELEMKPEDFVFIFVGRLVKDKGINELVSAFSKLQTPNSKLLLVGPFEEELDPLLPETLKEIQQNKNIISVGFQKDVRPYFAISNALVFPSYREGFPNVVLQAGAMGLPSIVSDISGCNEIIVENQNGIIIPVKDEQAIYNAMIKMKQGQEILKGMSKKARPMVGERYEQSVVWNAILEEYQKIIKEKINV